MPTAKKRKILKQGQALMYLEFLLPLPCMNLKPCIIGMNMCSCSACCIAIHLSLSDHFIVLVMAEASESNAHSM